MDHLDEIRSRLNIEDIVAPYVQLKKAGRSFKACCPFHQEKTPSFIVSPDKGLAYCFGCRKGGDIFAFIQQIENLSFPEAVEQLANRAGVTIERASFTKHHKDDNERLFNLVSQAQQFFTSELPSHLPAVNYLSARGYPLPTVKKIGIGYAPDDFHTLTNHLLSKGYLPKEILESGLANQKELATENIYDRFRGRIIFPIHDTQGRLVSFGGRTLSADPNTPKYLNGPETSIYHKGRTLYLFHQAKESIRKQDACVVVEGYFDALTAHLHGFNHIVASLGTALTSEQLKLIGRFTKNIAFAFDADISGQTANARSIELAQQLNFNITVIQIPSGKDPDEAIRLNVEEWKNAQKQARHIMDFYFERALKTHDISTVIGKKNIAADLLAAIRRISNAVEQEHFIQKLSGLLKTSVRSLYEEMKKIKVSTPSLSQNPSLRSPVSFAQSGLGFLFPSSPDGKEAVTRKDLLLGLLLEFPEDTGEVRSLLSVEEIPEEEYKSLYKRLLDTYTALDQNRKPKEAAHILAQGKDDLEERLHLLMLYIENGYMSFTEEERKREVQTLCESIRREHRDLKLRKFNTRLAQMEAEGKKSESDALLKEYDHLIKTIES